MHKSNRNSGSTVFYKQLTDATEVRSGYLYKSPPQKKLKTEKSWKKRYFVLFKVDKHQYQFLYFKSPEDKEKPTGYIDLTQVSVLYVNPHGHQKWGWVQRSFKCSSSCVLYIKTENRDYFLVGETSEVVDAWFSDLFDALKHRPHQCHSSEEIKSGQTTSEVISSHCVENKSPEAAKDLIDGNREPYTNQAGKTFLLPPSIKSRSMSDPSSNGVDNDTERTKEEDHAQRRASAPLDPIYDYPRPCLKSNVEENGVRRSNSMESLYVNMKDIKFDEDAAEPVEVGEGKTSTIMRSVTYVFDRFKTHIPPLSTNEGEMATLDREKKRQSSESSDSISPDEPMKNQSSTESLVFTGPGERDFEVKQADLKKHLTLIDIDGKPSVSGWTGQPQTVCLFHKGDQILAVNDLHTSSVEEFNLYISKSLKNEVKVTILRQPGCQPLHLPNCPCTD